MTFVDGISDNPTYEELVGTPEEIIQGARSFPDRPLETMWAQCLDDATIRPAGRYWYDTEQVLLEDDTSYTALSWSDEAKKHSAGLRTPLHKFRCAGCEAVTLHVALDERSVRGVLMNRGLIHGN